MSAVKNTQTLRKLCDALSDGKAVDWDMEQSGAPDLGSTIRRLREIEAVARAHRSIASTASEQSEPLRAAWRTGDSSAAYWGPLRLCEMVGQGSFGDVYRAIDTRLQREVAVKLRRLGFTDSDEGARRFLDEARSLARIRHPNVLTIHGADVHDLRVGFWTDFIHGKTLAARLEEEGPLGAGEAALLGLSLCGALAAVHAAGYVHGDVKAANVMREQGGRIVLMDFGAAHWRSDRGPSGAPSGPAFGTPLVLAPEIVRGEAARPESDLYSLGVLLYCLVTGRYPVEAKSWDELRERHARREGVSLRDARPALPADFVRAVERALAPDPADRYRGAGEMEQALFAALPSGEIPRDQVRTLRSLVEEIGPLPEEMGRRIACEAAKSLARIHAEGGSLGEFDLDGMLLLGHGGMKLLRSGVAPRAPQDPAGRAALQRADLRRLGENIRRARTGSEGVSGATLSPFFESLLRQLVVVEPGGTGDAGEGVRAAGSFTARELAQVLADGERSAWWRERVRAIRSLSPQRRLRISRETAIQGRDEDLRRLHAAYERAKAGEGQVVLLQGEAGIGKSRIVDELARTIEAEGEEASFLFGSYPPGGAATAAGAFLAAYRDHFGELGLEEAVAEALAPAPRLIEPFIDLLRGGGGTQESSPLTAASLQTAFVHVARALAADRPTIILIDDLHFAPEEGRALFTALALGVAGHRILLIGASRPELPEEWSAAILRYEHASRLALGRLDDQDVLRILAEALGSVRAAEELTQLLAPRCDGNPLFLLEHLHALEEARYLARNADGAWTVDVAGREIPRPESIRQIIRSRFAGLDAEDQQLLEIACCCGFEFDPALVAEAAGVEVLGALRRFGLMERRHGLIRAEGRHYVFDHHQVQETLYESLFEQLREHYHAALARALEAREGARERDPREIDGCTVVCLAEHYLKARQGMEGERYLLPALDHLARSYENGAAADLARRALDSPGLLAGAERIPVLKRLAARLEYLGRGAQENAALEEHLALSDVHDEPVGRARARRMLGSLRIRQARHEEARAVLEEALEIARACGDLEEESNATGALGLLAHQMGRVEEAKALITRGLELARQCGYKLQEIKLTGNLGVIFYAQGQLAETKATMERHLALSREAGYRLGEALAVGNLGVLLAEIGRNDEAREHHERHLELAREVGFRQAEAIATGNLGFLDLNTGRCAAALERLERMLALSTEIGFKVGMASAMQGFALALGALGRLDEARAWEERRLELGIELQSPNIEGEALLGLGDLASEAGDPAEAERLYRRALDRWTGTDHQRGQAMALVRLGRLCREALRNEEAGEHLTAGLALARESQLPGAIVTASIEIAFLPGAEPRVALDAFAANEGKLNHMEKLRARFRLFRRTGEPVHLEEARRLLAEFRIGAPEPDRDRMTGRVRLYREISAA